MKSGTTFEFNSITCNWQTCVSWIGYIDLQVLGNGASDQSSWRSPWHHWESEGSSKWHMDKQPPMQKTCQSFWNCGQFTLLLERGVQEYFDERWGNFSFSYCSIQWPPCCFEEGGGLGVAIQWATLVDKVVDKSWQSWRFWRHPERIG